MKSKANSDTAGHKALACSRSLKDLVTGDCSCILMGQRRTFVLLLVTAALTDRFAGLVKAHLEQKQLWTGLLVE